MQRLDDGLARQIAMLMAAHAVGDRPDARFRPGQIAVFVALSHLADMGHGAGLEHRLGLLHRQSPSLLYAVAELIWPVSMPANRNGSGIRRQQSASGWYSPPPTVHQKLAAA